MSERRDLGPLHGTICRACDGEGYDGDLPWADECDECAGTGIVDPCNPVLVPRPDLDCDCGVCMAERESR